jgi:hypothetical protein
MQGRNTTLRRWKSRPSGLNGRPKKPKYSHVYLGLRPAKPHENLSELNNIEGWERRGRRCIGAVEAVFLSDPERVC